MWRDEPITQQAQARRRRGYRNGLSWTVNEGGPLPERRWAAFLTCLLNFLKMLSSTESMQQAVRDIARWLVLTPNPGEAIVRQAIVLRLLQAAGFNIWNPAEVIPEETDKAGFRPDLRLVAGKHQIVLELKGMNIGLHDKDYQQVAAYAGSKGIRWALLSDGRAWVVIDEHLPGPYTERAILKLELNQNDLDEFASDILEMLNAKNLREGLFEGSVSKIMYLQKERRNVALIHEEKRPIVQAVQIEFGIDSFEKAAAASAKMGLITEAERDVLIGVINANIVKKQELKIINKASAKEKIVIEEDMEFSYQIGDIVARAIFIASIGIWRVKAGSLAVEEVRPYAAGVKKRRIQLLEDGSLEKLDDGRLRYLIDVDYSSPSSAADDISGASKNGWAVWVDDLGRPAQFHRPKKQGLIGLT